MSSLSTVRQGTRDDLCDITHLAVCVAHVLGRLKYERQAKVSDAGRHVTADEDVATLEVPVCNRRFVAVELRGGQVLVQERQALDHGTRNAQHLRPRH